MARTAEPFSRAVAVTWVYNLGIPCGVLAADDAAMREIEDALQNAERFGDDLAAAIMRMTLGNALVHRRTDAEHERGQQLLAELSDVFLRSGHNLGEIPLVNAYSARVRARRGDRDDAIAVMRAAADHVFREGRVLAWNIPLTGVLVETLLDRGTNLDSEGDLAEARAAIERLAAAPAEDGLVLRDIWLLRLRALLARAHGDTAAYADLRDRYRDMANSLGFEGHIAWADTMH